MLQRAYPWIGGLALAAGSYAALHDPILPMKAVWLGLLVFVARRFGRLHPVVLVAVPVAVTLALVLPELRSPIPHPWREEVAVVAPLAALVVSAAGVALARR